MAEHGDTTGETDRRLVAVRPRLLELHRQLLEAERGDMERFQGRLSGAEFLQIATDSLRLAWLQPISELIVEIDETLEGKEREPEASGGEDAATALIDRARALVAPPDADSAFGRRYLGMLQRHPGVVMAHSALLQAL
ncbi:MAG TPA: hypothetical protein VGI72_02125 [Gaiellales bacterium]|jgi:hypothetical protein